MNGRKKKEKEEREKDKEIEKYKEVERERGRQTDKRQTNRIKSTYNLHNPSLPPPPHPTLSHPLPPSLPPPLPYPLPTPSHLSPTPSQPSPYPLPPPSQPLPPPRPCNNSNAHRSINNLRRGTQNVFTPSAKGSNRAFAEILGHG